MNSNGIESRLGELMIVGVPGTELTPDVAQTLRRIGPAGVILFAANFTDADQAAKLARAAHEVV